MFYRTWDGLPVDPSFPSDLEKLGYFVNESDEIRSLEDEKYYFKFFINKNQRYNDRQRFAMNEAVEKVVHQRLEALGLKKTLLPLGTTDTSQPHLPVFVSSDIKDKSRVVVVIGETYQDLGILAHRVLGGPGGVDNGSMVSVVKTLQAQPSSPTDSDDHDASPPGIVLANTGQTVWSPALRRTLTLVGSGGAPMPSAVHAGPRWDGERERVPGNGDAREHIAYVFDQVVPALVGAGAGLDVIAVGDGADALEQYLDWPVTWARLAGRLNCLAIVGGYHAADNIKCSAFREFLRKKARAYATSSDPLGTPISGPDGNANTTAFTHLGCPLFSGGEPHYVEALLGACLPHLAGWLAEVARAGRGNYANPTMAVMYADPGLGGDGGDGEEEEDPWSKYTSAPVREQSPTDFGAGPATEVWDGQGGGKREDEDEDDEIIRELEKGLIFH
ncbi:hypothetical protein JX266_010147 [Neoarthrinium moseri]|nr:hypothetical protein JX266_010147 [Neoarthrinium moseri]